MSQQMAFYVEQKHCTGCSACQIACKDKHNLPKGQTFRKVHAYEGGTFKVTGPVVVHNVYAYWISVSCNHCVNAPCLTVCPRGQCINGQKTDWYSLMKNVALAAATVWQYALIKHHSLILTPAK